MTKTTVIDNVTIETDEHGLITKYEYTKWEHSGLLRLINQLNKMPEVLGTIASLEKKTLNSKPILYATCYIDERAYKNADQAVKIVSQIMMKIEDAGWKAKPYAEPHLNLKWKVSDARLS